MKPAARWLAAAALAALWLPLFRLWGAAWSAAPEQAYGWAVPILAVWLAWERAREAAPAPGVGRGARRLAWGAAVPGLLLLMAALPVLEANPMWPTAQWAGAAGAMAVTLAGLVLLGGPRWAAHFVFPLCFLTTALTWPTPLHGWIVSDLAGTNAALAAEFVSACGHPAVVTGNVITVATGAVGVDEACSGLRSLQAVWMAAWFLGESFRLNGPRRLGLLVASLVAAMGSNLLRTTFLTWEAAADSLAASERWHDRAGAAELVLTLGLVVAAAAFIGRRQWRRPRPVATATLAAGAWRGLRPLSVVALVGALSAVAGTEAWYRAHEQGEGARVHWTMSAPDASWRPVPLPPRVQEVLRYTQASGLAWRDPATGVAALVFLISWQGDAANGENPEWHDPTICLPAAGVRLSADLGEVTVPIGGVDVPFASYRFLAGADTRQVFFCHWDAELGRARADAATPGAGVRARRLQRVREGRRRNDVAHITLELQAPDDAAALAWLRAWAPRLLRPHLSVP